MSNQERELRAISREWAAARIVIIGGFIIALGLGGYFAWIVRQNVVAHRQQVLAQVQQVQAYQNAQEQGQKAAEQLCQTALANAKTFGIVPQFGKLAIPLPQRTDVKGRYVCIAVSQVSKYTIAADAVCRNLANAQCVNVYSVTQDDGTVLFQRHT